MNKNRNIENNSLSEETRQWLSAILDAFDGMNWLTDRDGRFVLCNRLARPMSSDGHLPLLEGPKVSLDLAELVLSVAAENKPLDLAGLAMNEFCRDKNKSARLRIVPVNGPSSVTQWFLINLIESEQVHDLSTQTAETEKLTSLTGLAAKIAHELNNPLDGSIRYLKLAQRRLSQNHEPENSGKVSEYLSSAQEALGKINGILSDLVRFAKNGQSNLESISVNDLIEQAVRTLSARASLAGVSIVTMLAEDLPHAGGPKLYQVFCNLIKNAIDAIEEKRRRDSQAVGRITVITSLRDGLVHITVEDTGVGLPEDRQYLFDPFFTTKGPDDGTGLGLAISQEIVKQYHGKITADDGQNGGACFTIELSPISKSIVKQEGCAK